MTGAMRAMPEAGLFRSDGPILLIGDSLTESWGLGRRAFFLRHGLVAHGVGGETSGQIRLRFDAALAAARPRRVHLWCGLNDIFGPDGPVTLDEIAANVAAMLDHARARGVPAWLGAVTPTRARLRASDPPPAPRIIALNRLLRRLADARGVPVIDYHTPLRTGSGGIRPALTWDGIHLNAAGTAVVEACFLARLGGAPARPSVRARAYRCRDALAAGLTRIAGSAARS
ncbi:GDSL-type esterase/lipase family protein [Methylobacterium sp. NEAU 140]|uniref:SGNH/GDSL hydrolase family protein n=1 Tax=Methylobacterium sp. NEAU 140 TaxID=3064945 RepID=UPI00273321B6|nr:GDSL-type esterase/lipase family protein [Methylobacterium sp. NEAU 140]MDP4024207.1 GDSL-type esterase/lipase family protein [Methylobacterium sp. NEAU 140]